MLVARFAQRTSLGVNVRGGGWQMTIPGEDVVGAGRLAPSEVNEAWCRVPNGTALGRSQSRSIGGATSYTGASSRQAMKSGTPRDPAPLYPGCNRPLQLASRCVEATPPSSSSSKACPGHALDGLLQKSCCACWVTSACETAMLDTDANPPQETPSFRPDASHWCQKPVASIPGPFPAVP